MGDNPNAQSGVAIKALQNKGDTGTIKYFNAQEVAICHTARIIIDAIPAVYESERVVRILNEDGSFDMTSINQKVLDEETGREVTLNDLSAGTYDVTCSAGPSFQNRQQETVASMVEVAQVDPTIIELGGDILLNNISAPGMNKMAERKRQMLLNQGVIPLDQMTDEEKQALQQQQANQQQGPSPEELIGQAEMIKAQTDQQTAQFEQQVKQIELQQAQQKLDQEGAKIQSEAQNKEMNTMLQNQKQQMDILTSATDQMAKLTAAFGIDAIAGSEPANIIAQQGNIIDDAQDRVS
jgi:hypothetical protein